MGGSTVMVVAMVAIMLVMCGGMVAGAVWFIRRRRRGELDENTGSRSTAVV